MKKVEITFWIDIEDEDAFIAAANEPCYEEWGCTIEELYPPDGDTPALVGAAVEYWLVGDGPWPPGVPGVADDAYFDWSGRVIE